MKFPKSIANANAVYNKDQIKFAKPHPAAVKKSVEKPKQNQEEQKIQSEWDSAWNSNSDLHIDLKKSPQKNQDDGLHTPVNHMIDKFSIPELMESPK